MVGFWCRSVMAGLVALVVTAAAVGPRAASAACPYPQSCPEEAKDGRGCCPPPAADAAATKAKKEKQDEARRAAEKERAEAKAAEDARRAAEKKKADAKAAEDARRAEEKRRADAKAAEDAKKAADVRADEDAKVRVPPFKLPPPSGSCPADMVHVPGATFLLGSPDGVGDSDEHPQHRVTLSGYCIDRTEVTVAAYARCVASGECTAVEGPGKEGFASLCNGTRADRQDHPVNCVDWNQARVYCAFVNRRLPSEAEWEYAARGGDGRTYPWGNEPPGAKRLNACGGECRALGKRLGMTWSVMYEDSDKWEATAPVGSFPLGASPFGALDMAGNVWEWTADWYGAYQPGASTNPSGAKDGSARVVRGGGWIIVVAGGVRAANRNWVGPAFRISDLGFRCARGD